MKLCLKLVMLFAVIASMSSCKDAQSATAIASIQNLLEEIKQTGKAWVWADFDVRHKRIVYAEKGCIYAISLRGSKLESKLLYDFNDMQFEALPAPY